MRTQTAHSMGPASPQHTARWVIPTVLVLGIVVPIVGTSLLGRVFADWRKPSLPFHSTLEVAGAALGLVLAVIILFTRQAIQTSRRMWIASALIAMAVLDIFHSCVPAGVSFVWLHSLAVLAGGLFFALVWFPERDISRTTALVTACAVLLVSLLVGALSTLFPASLPAMMEQGGFTPAAQVINLVGGGLTILAALSFGIRYARYGDANDLLFWLLCLLFGVSGVIFYMSAIWEAGWWFWHVLRFAAYLSAFLLALIAYRRSEDETLRAHSELDGLFHAAVDAKRLVDRQFNQLRANDAFVAMSGVSVTEGAKCHELLAGPLCHTDQCPIRQLESGVSHSIEREVLKTTRDGRQVPCLLKAVRLDAPDGSFRGVLESFMDLSDQKRSEEAIARQSRLVSGINEVFREALTAETEEEVGKTALRVAERLTGSRFGWIGLLNPSGLMDTVAISNPGWEACDVIVSDAKNFVKDMPLRGIDRTALKDGKSRIVNADQIATHPDRVGTPEGHPPLTCFLGVPFGQGGETVGMVGLANKEGGYDLADQEAIETFSVAFYEALMRKRIELRVQAESILKTTQMELADQMRGDPTTAVLCQRIITHLCNRLQAPTGLLYLAGNNGSVKLVASHAHKRKNHLATEYALGEGLVGQAALEQKETIITDVPTSYFTIESGLGETLPRCVLIKPIVRDKRVKAVVELGALEPFDPSQSHFLDTVAGDIAVAVESAQARGSQAELLDETQRQSEELQAQQEELKAANEELEEQAQMLRDSEAELRAQHEELQAANEELEEKTELLERQKRDVEAARSELAEKATDLALASRYKSEFLSNMSHELRTPLNSLLLLAGSLSENKDGNLTEDQVESSKVIYQGGNELLSLINEILDLSKIEAGRMELHFESVQLSDLAASLRSAFQHLAQSKNLTLSVSVEDGAPASIRSDRKRLEQIIKNLVANAIKFTDRGGVQVVFGSASSQAQLTTVRNPAVAIAVEDTGIGISAAQRKVIFEAFQQGDGSTARKYGGTGLGLSIARDLTRLLGGEIHLRSEPDKGSTFIVYLPVQEPDHDVSTLAPAPQGHAEPDRADPPSADQVSSIADDRGSIQKSDRSILIIEDDSRFAEILAGQCREQGFKVLAAATGEAGIDLARRFLPRGILLDLKLPGMDGWRVLDLLKDDPATRHIPVHVASAEEPSATALRKGAIGHVQKPVSVDQIADTLKKLDETAGRMKKRVLVVEDDEDTRRGIVKLIAEDDVAVDEAAGADQAVDALRSHRYDCMILDLGLWDCDGDELLGRIDEDEKISAPPVIVYTARDLTWQQDLELRSHADSVVIKGVRSDERLVDEVSLFLHRVVADMPEKKRQVVTNLHDTNALLRGKKALVVDDDMRTLFALTKILADRGMEILKADNGERALALLDQHPNVDVVLMDIMMPVLDGYETMRRIRAQERFSKTPIIALTAKAMREDREHCIETGASDYLAKPVDQDRLVSMLRVWLYR